MEITEKIDIYLGETLGLGGWGDEKLPMTRREALDKMEDTDDKDALGFYVRVASLGGATQHEMKSALDGRRYNMFKGDVNDKKYKKYL